MPAEAKSRGNVTVIGAGIVGASCALALRREGFEVTVIERDEVGGSATYGNAGIISRGA